MARCAVWLASVSILAMNCVWPTAADAQEAPSAEIGQDEIVVTAQRREQRLQDVPLSVAAFSSKEIAETRMNDLETVAAFTPNFSVGAPDPGQLELSIRGVSTNDREAGSDRSVVLFIDEEYIGRAGASALDLFDVERVEVLRGPQGTLFGRNVSGGAVSITTNKPTQRWEGALEGGVGNLGLFEARGMINVPVTAGSALRAAVSARTRDGASRNVFLGDRRVGDVEEYSGRVHYAFTPAPNLDGLLTFEASKDSVDGLPARLVKGQATDAGFAGNVAALGGLSNPLVSLDRSVYDVANNILGRSDRESYAGRGRLEWSGDAVRAILLASYRDNHLRVVRDVGGIPITGTGPESRGFNSTQDADERYKSFSLEARLASDGAPSDPLHWIVGVYYLHESTDRDLATTRQANNGFSAPLFEQQLTSRSIAAFAEASFRPIEQIELTAGGRYTHDDKDYALAVVETLSAAERAEITARLGRAPNLAPALEPYSVHGGTDSGVFTPKLAARLILDRDMSIYALWSRGYKAGGFVGVAPTAAGALLTFAPEHVDNLEAGIKGRFLDHRLALNLSVFRMNFSDLQLADLIEVVPGDPTTVIRQTTNAARAHIRGIEADMTLDVTDRLTLAASGALLDTEVVEVRPGSSVVLGAPLARAPEHSLNLSARYEVPVRSGRLAARVDYHITSESYADVNANAASYVEPHNTLDARLFFTFDRSGVGVSLWGKNLTNQSYVVGANSFSDGQAAFAQFSDPRTYGASVSWSF